MYLFAYLDCHSPVCFKLQSSYLYLPPMGKAGLMKIPMTWHPAPFFIFKKARQMPLGEVVLILRVFLNQL